MNGIDFRGTGGLLQKIFTGVLLLLLLAFWVIALAGTAATQSACVKLKPVSGGGQTGTTDEKYCNNLVKFLWWGVWFEFVCVILAFLCAIIPFMMSNMGNTTTVFFIMCTVVLMINANNYNDNIYFYDTTTSGSRWDDLKSGLQCGMAGAVGLLVLNFLYLIGMTFGENYSYSAPAPAMQTQPAPKLDTTTSQNPPYPPQSTPSYGQPAPYSPNAQPYAPGPGPQGYGAQGSPPPMQPYSPPPNPYYVQQGAPGTASAAGGPPPS